MPDPKRFHPSNTLRSLLLIAFLAAPAAAQQARIGAQQPRISAQRDHSIIMHNGIARSYIVRVPADIAKQKKGVALVIVMHGGGGEAVNAEHMTGFTPKAMKEGFIVVYPDGTSALGNRLLTWNAGHCCGYAMQHRINDAGFISALIDTLVRQYPIDTKRVYATGMSNGAMMSHRAGIDLASKIASIAPVVGTLFGDEIPPKWPVSAIILNGMLDTNVPNAGGKPSGRFPGAWDGASSQPAADQSAFWAKADGCDMKPETHDDDKAISTRYHCPGGIAVEQYIVKNNGHAWPGGEPGTRFGDKPSPAFHATDIIWEFFKAHPKKT